MTRHPSKPPRRDARSPRSRRGTVYVLVLVSAMIVTVIGLTGVAIVRQDLSRSELNLHSSKATAFAHSAIELGLTEMYANTAWRTSYTNGSKAITRSLDGGTLSIAFSDPADSNLANNTTDIVLLRAVGTKGLASQIVEVKVVPTLPPLPGLLNCMTTGSTINFSGGKVRGTALIHSKGFITATSATIRANVQSGSTISGTTYLGTKAAAAAVPIMPVSATVVADYAALATPISYSSLGGGDLKEVVLSSGRNPYGSVNAQGIYVIDCANKDLKIKDCRINGTLVIRNGKTVTVSDSVLIQTTSPSLPALIIEGATKFDCSEEELSESLFVNFNPVGAPYMGITDFDSSDNYPSRIQGLVAIFGTLSVPGSATCNIVGPVFVSGAVTIQGSLVLTDDAAVSATPPAGFTLPPTYAFDDLTWKRSLN